MTLLDTTPLVVGNLKAFSVIKIGLQVKDKLTSGEHIATGAAMNPRQPNGRAPSQRISCADVFRRKPEADAVHVFVRRHSAHKVIQCILRKRCPHDSFCSLIGWLAKSDDKQHPTATYLTNVCMSSLPFWLPRKAMAMHQRHLLIDLVELYLVLFSHRC
jgi:hypothetical protein